ncbi:MAG: hypothetical protein ACRYFS_23005 [Janthinobacterium lividum]
MQKYDWLRLFSEVRPTFLPYARFTVQTHLSPEQCQERLASVTQPQKMPAVIPVRTSDDTRLVFKGQVSRAGFFIVPVDRHGRPKYQGPQPFWLVGRFQNTFRETRVIVKVFPDPFGFFTGCLLLGILIAALVMLGSSSILELIIQEPVLLLGCVFIYATLAFPTSIKAFQMKPAFKRLLQND